MTKAIISSNRVTENFNVDTINPDCLNINQMMKNFKVYFNKNYLILKRKKLKKNFDLKQIDPIEFEKIFVRSILEDINKCKKKLESLSIMTFSTFSTENLSYENLFLLKVVKDLTPQGTNFTIIAGESGAGCCFFIEDGNKKKRAVIKPLSKDVGGLYNKNAHHRTAYSAEDLCYCRPVKNYQSSFNEVAASHLSKIINHKSAVPETILVNLPTSFFFDGISPVASQVSKQWDKVFTPSHTNEVCSLQYYEENTITLKSLITQFPNATELKSKISQEAFDATFLTVLASGDVDAHDENFILRRDNPDDFFKIDNGFSFPSQPGSSLNELNFLPHASELLSEKFIQSVNRIDSSEVIDSLLSFHLDSEALVLTERRLKALKKIVNSFPKESYRDLNLRYQIALGDFNLQVSDRLDLAMKPLAILKNLKKLIRLQSSKKYFLTTNQHLNTHCEGIVYSLRGKKRIEDVALRENISSCNLNDIIYFYEDYKNLRKFLKTEASMEMSEEKMKMIEDEIEGVATFFTSPGSIDYLKSWLREDLSDLIPHFNQSTFLDETINNQNNTLNTQNCFSVSDSYESFGYDAIPY